VLEGNPAAEETIMDPESATNQDLAREPLVPTASVSRALEDWYAAVEEYSDRQLTLPEDKLLAISGIATEISAFMPASTASGLNA